MQPSADFIRGLDLGRPRHGLSRSTGRPVLDEGSSGSIDDSSLVSFVSGVSEQHKSDVLDSTLLAQLAATQKFNPESEVEQWYGFYRTVLENVGWVIGDFNFSKYETGGSTFEIDEVVIAILAAIATENEIAVVKETLEALKNLSDGDDRLTLWSQATHTDTAGSFRIATCVEDDSNVAMKLGAFYFSAQQTDARVLWFSYSEENCTLYKAGQSLVLNDAAYAQVREEIIEKLGDKRHRFVASLDIG